MGSSGLVVLLIAATSTGASIPKEEVEIQNETFSRYWNDDFVWRFDDLPSKGSVPKHRIPYSGYIYLDTKGGTAAALRKYDEAINKNFSYPATAWENSDTSQAYERRVVRGLFGRSRSVGSVNAWYGHCNGWSSAAIRHAEPQHNVTINGVTFTPADIKGLLAEIYMYNDHTLLAGFENNLNPRALHVVLANWIGRGSHPIVMDADPTKEKWNYPIYAFASSHKKRSPREIEVKTVIHYAKDSEDREHIKSPRLKKEKLFHYMLELDRYGDITGGYYFSDSDRIDFLWVPLTPKKSGAEGNERGNPHVDVSKVLSIWRQSVPLQARRQWMIVDPAERDRAVEVPDPNKILPRRIKIVPPVVGVQ